MKLDELKVLIKDVRKFYPSIYISEKVNRINQFFHNNQLDSCVIGVSGGIDSAVTLGLLRAAMKQYKAPLKRILPLIMPIHGDGTTGQDEATQLAIAQCEAFGLDYRVVDLSGAYQEYLKASNTATNTPTPEESWTNGQLASILRTPCSYYHAAILQAQGFKSIVVGTTNRDEGSYIGFYGKASDAMVDLQPIADIHKSEVYAISALLGVIGPIYSRAPRGDVWDGRTSEEMMGVPYWFLEMYLVMLSHNLMALKEKLSKEDQDLFYSYYTKIDELHQKNGHKYEVGLPSHFIDCMERKVPGGW